MKRISLVSLAVFLWMCSPALADVIEAGNTVCPVSGDKVSGKHFVLHEGKKYGLCCPHCEKEFKKDPEKYIATLAESGIHPQGGHGHEGHSH